MTSKASVLAVIVFLGLIVLGVILGDIVLIAMNKPTLPSSIEALAAGAGGALAGILASTRSTLGPRDTEPSTVTLSSPTPVAVVAPVPTEGTFPGKP